MSDVGTSWSRRRAAVAAEAEAEDRAARDLALREEQAALAEKTDEEILEDLDLPDPESLGPGDDFRGFMSKTVPEHIRKRALRKLWRSNPVLACVDGLNDYDDDYLTGSVGQGVINTTYQVGKGMLAQILEGDRDSDAAATPALAPEVEEDAVEPRAAVAEEGASDGADGAMTVHQAETDDIHHAAALRRMKFQFKDGTA